MKIRTSFVSNSSSSSFIVISDSIRQDKSIKIEENNTLIIPEHLGEQEFGWQVEKYNDFYSKAKFARIQAKNINEQHWLLMLNSVIKEELGVKEIYWNFEENNAGYVDHQSSSTEDQNTGMFESKEELKKFLFSLDSYIYNGNDNY